MLVAVASEWTLIGVSNGIEEWEAREAKSELLPSSVWTKFEPRPIEVSSESVSEVAEHEVTVKATVNPEGFETKYVVEYGEGSPEHTTAEMLVPGTGLSPVPVSARLTGLPPHHRDEYRFKAFHPESGLGEPAYGEVGSFITLPYQCLGSDIAGQGSSLQSIAQIDVWDPDFNTSANKMACDGSQGSGGKPTVTYSSTGSGAGLKAFGAEGGTPNYSEDAFVGTDEPPNPTQKAEIEAHGASGTLETIPVLQGAVAIIVNLPEGCVATSKSAKGRLVLNDPTLEGIYRGTIKKWSEITENGDKITAETGKTCNTGDRITVVVRKDHSGTTHILKAAFEEIDKEPFETEVDKTKTWEEVAEGSENQTWPKATEAVRPEEATGPGLVKKVAETPSSIGYANLADARSNGAFTPGTGKGGEKTARFWVELQNKPAEESYADPSSNKDAEKAANANCSGEEYVNANSKGEPEPFPPSNTLEPWNKVTAALNQKDYTLCGLTYDLAFNKYSAYPGTSFGEATTASNFLQYALQTTSEGGGELIKSHDYLALPQGDVLTEAKKGAAEIAY